MVIDNGGKIQGSWDGNLRAFHVHKKVSHTALQRRHASMTIISHTHFIQVKLLAFRRDLITKQLGLEHSTGQRVGSGIAYGPSSVSPAPSHTPLST